MKLHAFTIKLLSWWVCNKCGLITLNNEATRKAMRKPCPGSEED